MSIPVEYRTKLHGHCSNLSDKGIFGSGSGEDPELQERREIEKLALGLSICLLCFGINIFTLLLIIRRSLRKFIKQSLSEAPHPALAPLRLPVAPGDYRKRAMTGVSQSSQTAPPSVNAGNSSSFSTENSVASSACSFNFHPMAFPAKHSQQTTSLQPTFPVELARIHRKEATIATRQGFLYPDVFYIGFIFANLCFLTLTYFIESNHHQEADLHQHQEEKEEVNVQKHESSHTQYQGDGKALPPGLAHAMNVSFLFQPPLRMTCGVYLVLISFSGLHSVAKAFQHRLEMKMFPQMTEVYLPATTSKSHHFLFCFSVALLSGVSGFCILFSQIIKTEDSFSAQTAHDYYQLVNISINIVAFVTQLPLLTLASCLAMDLPTKEISEDILRLSVACSVVSTFQLVLDVYQLVIRSMVNNEQLSLMQINADTDERLPLMCSLLRLVHAYELVLFPLHTCVHPLLALASFYNLKTQADNMNDSEDL